MDARLSAAAFLLSILVPLCEALWPGVALARGSLSALALFPWLALASLPRVRHAGPAPAWRVALWTGSLALPPLCLGAGIDLARGAEARVLLALLPAAWAVVVLWSWAAERSARQPRARGGFALAWFLLLPAAGALRLALAWVPLRAGMEEPARARLFALDPLIWCHRWGRPGGLAELELAELTVALGSAFLVAAMVHALGRAERPGGSA